MLLTDEEIKREILQHYKGLNGKVDLHSAYQAIAKAQLKKVVEWLNEPCPDCGMYQVSRWGCPECRQALQDKVK